MKRFLLLAALAALLFFASALLASSGSFTAFLEGSTALSIVSLMALSLALMSFVFGIVTGDYSWVDRLWSTAPVVFAWVYAWKASFSWTAAGAALLVSTWGLRLTFNFARKGGYRGVEDYRWPVLRQRLGTGWAWQTFHLLFICGFQVGLFILFTAPLGLISGSPGNLLLLSAAGALALFFLFLETLADQQQWDFYRARTLYRQSADDDFLNGYPYKGDLAAGFLRSGLFSVSRHPNYLGELGFWWSIWLLGSAAAGSFGSWTLIGPVLLTLLFIGSTRFTEDISASKYSDYAEYRRQTGAIIPNPLKLLRAMSQQNQES